MKNDTHIVLCFEISNFEPLLLLWVANFKWEPGSIIKKSIRISVSAFFHCVLKEEKHTKLPDENKICELNRSKHGLNNIAKVGLVQSISISNAVSVTYARNFLDWGNTNKNIYLVLYVDDFDKSWFISKILNTPRGVSQEWFGQGVYRLWK